MEKTVKLITCDDAFRAHLIQGALDNEGIPSVIHNENTSNVMRGFVSNLSGVDVLVYEADHQKALAILEQNQMVGEQLKYCPFCGSDDIKFGLKKGKRLRTFFAAILALLSLTPPGTAHWEWHCRRCGARFEQPVSWSHRPEKED